MALSEFEVKRIEKLVGEFIDQIRPPSELRMKIDISFKITGPSFEIFEIRPRWDDPSQKIESPVAKATYVKKSAQWKLYWMRENLKWYSYEPFPASNSIDEILKTIRDDEYNCFWG